MIKRLQIVFLLFCCIPLISKSQVISVEHSEDEPNFFSIQKEFYDRHKEDKTGSLNEEERDGDYVKYKRWEWYWKQRVGKSGKFPPSDILLTELQKYRAEHSGNNSRMSVNNSATWTFFGPSIAFTGYSGIGRVLCIAFHPYDLNTFWIGTPAGGIWKTNNGGSTWTTNSDDLPTLGVTAIVVHPTSPNILYIATGDGVIGGGPSGRAIGDTKSVGILKSLDGGITWNPTGLNWIHSDSKVIGGLAMSHASPEILIAATSDGLYKTSDAGATWIKTQNGWFNDVEFKPTDDSYIYAATHDIWGGNSQIFTSNDRGDSWTQVTNLTGICRINLSVSANTPNDVDAICANLSGGNLNSLLRSTNSGASFSPYLSSTSCETNYLSHDRILNASTCSGQGRWDLAFTKNPLNANEIWLGGVNSWKSTNAGSSWTIKNFWWGNFVGPAVHADKHMIAYHPLDNNRVYECNDGGLFLTTDGGSSWTNLSNGLGITEIYKLGTSATVADRVIVGTQDNSNKELTGGSWRNSFESGDGIECMYDYSNSNIIYAQRIGGVLHKSTNAGTSWGNSLLNSNGVGPNSEGEWLTPLVMNPDVPTELLIGKAQVYKTTDGGYSWNQLGNISGLSGNDKLVTLVYAPSNTQIIFAASHHELFKTSDGGNSWSPLSFNSNEGITSISVSHSNPQYVWLTLSGYSNSEKVLHSTDGGVTWSNFSGTLPNVPVNCSVYEKNSDDGVYIGTDLGVFFRDNTMSDWIPFDNGLPNVNVSELEISYINNKIWAATYGRGLWRSELYSVIGVDEVNLDRSITLFPNPSHGTFSITSSIESNDFELSISNAVGEVIRRQKLDARVTQIDLDSEANGVYFVNVNSEKGSTTKKLVLCK